MLQFRQKEFSEYDAMRSLYVELMKFSDRNKFKVIDSKALIPILKGNNVVIERFVITTGLFRKDRYRMYLKIGAKAKLPDDVRMPSRVYDKRLLGSTLHIGNTNNGGNNNQDQQNKKQNNFSEVAGKFRIKMFGKKGGGGNNSFGASFDIPVNISYEVKELLADAVSYNKKERSLVLEMDSIQDAIRALNILPFGIDYKIYLLDL